MPIDRTELLAFLKELDSEFTRPVRLNAVGGTALTLLDVKPSTIDVDFDATKTDRVELERVLNRLNPGFKVDLYSDGYIFALQLPRDYLDKCRKIGAPFKNITLYAIAPIDLIVSKAARLNNRDINDIKLTERKFGPKKAEIKRRAKLVGNIVNPENYAKNIIYVLEKCMGLHGLFGKFPGLDMKEFEKWKKDEVERENADS